MDTQEKNIELNQPKHFKDLQLICTCSDDFFVNDKEFQQCLKGCKW